MINGRLVFWYINTVILFLPFLSITVFYYSQTFRGQQPKIHRCVVAYENRTTGARGGLQYKSDRDARRVTLGCKLQILV